MATATDLQGFLTADDNNLQLRMIDWFGKHAGQRVGVNVRWKPISSSSFERLHDEPLSFVADVAGATAAIEEVARIIIERQGTNPHGTVRVQGYEQGKSSAPSLDMTRLLNPSGGDGDPSLVLVRGQLSQSLARCQHLENILSQQLSAQTVLIAQQSLALQQLATVRTASSASSDLSGLPTLLAGGALILGWPSIKAALGLPPEAPINEVITKMRASLMAPSGPAPVQLMDRAPPRLPLGAAAPNGSAEPAAEAEMEAQPNRVAVLKEGIRKAGISSSMDLADALELAAELRADPELSGMLAQLAQAIGPGAPA